MTNSIKSLIAKRYFIVVLLLIHFLLNVLFYLNTNAFKEISESASVFDKLDLIQEGERPALVSAGYFSTPAYIAWFFISLFGNLHSYFIFQCFLSTVTTYIVFRIVLQITDNKLAGAIAIFLMTIYTEYLLLSSIFYHQSYEIFFTAITLWLTLLLFREKKLLRSVVFIFSICAVVIVSLIFRYTLLKIYYYFFAVAIICLITKYYNDFYKFLTTSVILYIVIVMFNLTSLVNEVIVGVYPSPFFWGHTMYGGKGGENGFIYQKNEDLYNKRLQEYVVKNKIDTIDSYVIRKFMDSEVSRFIREEPHKWVFLQFKKFFYTFGSVPQRDGLKMLMTGNVRMHWTLSAALLQIPFVLIIFLFILCVDYRIRSIFCLSNYKFFVYLLGLYLITAICFYIGTQERYRPIVLVLFFIPVIAINRKKLKILFLPENRKELFIKLFFICLFIAIWIYQAYEALVIDAERNFKVIQ